jgi:3-methyladenine DNA glycosylase AlkD
MKNVLHPQHATLLKSIQLLAKTNPFHSKLDNSYSGHADLAYPLSNPQLRVIAKDWVSKNQQIDLDDYLEMLDSFYQHGVSATEKYLAGYLLLYLPKLRRQILPQKLDNWLNYLSGWEQVDSLCQSKFSADDLFENWSQWLQLLENLNSSSNINKRRASLVLLTKPVRDSQDKKFSNAGLKNINSLLEEDDILITKAISWLLREMIKNHREEVEVCLEKNSHDLPKIAVREVSNKLKTGRK